MEPSRLCLKRILRRGIKRGQLPETLDIEAAMALLLSPLLYGHIFQKETGAVQYDFGRHAAESFWRSHCVGVNGPEPKNSKRPPRDKALRSAIKATPREGQG